MSILEEMVLAPGVAIVPVTDFASTVRSQIECDDDCYAISRDGGRTISKIFDRGTVDVLRLFQEPITIVDAILQYARERELQPETTLEESYPLIGRLLKAQLLVRVSSKEFTASLEDGEAVGDFIVRQCLQVLEDTEVYRVEGPDGFLGALKLFISEESSKVVARHYRCEVAALRWLDGGPSPKLLAEGCLGDRRYMVMEWCDGKTADRVSADLRRQREVTGDERLLTLCARILDAYTELHERGVFHSGVHPKNVLIALESVRLIGFSRARIPAEAEAPWPFRGGIGFFFEPEYARAYEDRECIPTSFSGEQYSVAALLYFLITGHHTRDFSTVKKIMYRQINQEPPIGFTQRGLPARPCVEAVLMRALEQDPETRWPVMGAFRDAFIAAADEDLRVEAQGEEASEPRAQAEDFLSRVLGPLSLRGALLESGIDRAPTCSVNFGAAGIAYALYRIAMVRNDTALLSVADIWACRAKCGAEHVGAFASPVLKLTEDVIGRVSPYHSITGVHAVQALISHARAARVTQKASLLEFVEAARAPCDNPDLTLGQAGVLLATALLLETLAPGPSMLESALLLNLGREKTRLIWDRLVPIAPIPEEREVKFLGIAHGWGGMLYALLLWSRVSGDAPPVGLQERLEQLAGLGERRGSGLRWRRKLGLRDRHAFMPTWCNGSVGMVFLWILAHRFYGEDGYLELAEQAAWNGWEECDAQTTSLCCGLSGNAYSLLSLYKHTGDISWRQRAERLAHVAMKRDLEAGTGVSHSLYKGRLGTAVLAADLAHPETACMPFFEDEGC